MLKASVFPCLFSENLQQVDVERSLMCRDCSAMAAVHYIKPMRGGSQSQLLLGSDHRAWVVKFRNNPQHKRILVNEHLVSGLARAIGLSVPKTSVICVSPTLLSTSPALTVRDVGGKISRCASGPQFASQFAGGMLPSFVLDYLPNEKLLKVENLAEFLGALVLDKWTGNSDARQAVFVRTERTWSYKAFFIDFGHCFNGGMWNFPDAPLAGVYANRSVYADVTGWESFEPWLSRVESMSIDLIWQLSKTMPTDWYDGDTDALQALVGNLERRRLQLRQFIHEFHMSDISSFPKWSASARPPRMAQPSPFEWSGTPTLSGEGVPLPYVHSNLKDCSIARSRTLAI